MRVARKRVEQTEKPQEKTSPKNKIQRDAEKAHEAPLHKVMMKLDTQLREFIFRSGFDME